MRALVLLLLASLADAATIATPVGTFAAAQSVACPGTNVVSTNTLCVPQNVTALWIDYLAPVLAGGAASPTAALQHVDVASSTALPITVESGAIYGTSTFTNTGLSVRLSNPAGCYQVLFNCTTSGTSTVTVNYRLTTINF